jgi:hypothetical protein
VGGDLPGPDGPAGPGRRGPRGGVGLGRRPRVAFAFTFADGRIVAIDLLADPERLARVEPAPSTSSSV